jgi:transcriptional regulator MftR-like protein
VSDRALAGRRAPAGKRRIASCRCCRPVLEGSSAGTPVDVVREALLKLASRFQERKMIATARLMRASTALRARNQGRFLQFEQTVFEALCELWPRKDRRDRLRLVAMASMGVLRLSVDAWLDQDGKRPLAKHIEDAFKNLKAEI